MFTYLSLFLRTVGPRLQSSHPSPATHHRRCDLQDAKAIGDEFLVLEKYVNLNYLVGPPQHQPEPCLLKPTW